MSDSEHQDDVEDPGPTESGPEPGTPEPARLRRRPFGYKRADVDQAIESRDAHLVELRQDIAALWLAFAQHDRMIRGLAGAGGVSKAGVTSEPTPAISERRAMRSGEPDDIPAPDSGEAIGRQLSDLDDVLAAIEMATQTLERTYADEVDQPPESADSEGSDPANEPAESLDEDEKVG